MCDFKVGDEVICIDAKPDCMDPKANLLVEGRVYVVASVGNRSGDGALSVGFRCLRPTKPGKCYGFTVRRFRKVQRRDLTAWLSTSVPNTDALDKPIRAPKRERVS